MADSDDEGPSNRAVQRSEESIAIFLRLKPVANPSKSVQYDTGEGTVEFHVPKDAVWGIVNNTRERYVFAFDAVFGPDASQEAVFQRVARPAVLGALDGFNGTVFAYGQTGSGKTFTLSGGGEQYSARGLTPRALELLFAQLAARGPEAERATLVRCSYLEIYNEQVYDLLGEPIPAAPGDVAGAPRLPKVTLLDDGDVSSSSSGGSNYSGNITFRGLSMHPVDSADGALRLLFRGDCARSVAETSSNIASSRSHVVFTAHIECRTDAGTSAPLIRSAKLHLVDLAGSERIGKTGLEGGALLAEAKHINLSLSYLEQVIVALQERASGLERPHIPYRNSTLTTVLRDSLGGNARTAMVATVTPSAAALEESCATCRFAQRVACVSNDVGVNEAIDLPALVTKLRGRVRELKAELRLARSCSNSGSNACEPAGADVAAAAEEAEAAAAAFLAGESNSLDYGGSAARVRLLFDSLRACAIERSVAAEAAGRAAAEEAAAALNAQRDAELCVLLRLLAFDSNSESNACEPLQLAQPCEGALEAAFCSNPSAAAAAAALPGRIAAFEHFRRAALRACSIVRAAGGAEAAAAAAGKAAALRANAARESIAIESAAAPNRRLAALRTALTETGDAWKEASRAAEAAAAAAFESNKREHARASAEVEVARAEVLRIRTEVAEARRRAQAAFEAWLGACCARPETPCESDSNSRVFESAPPLVHKLSPVAEEGRSSTDADESSAVALPPPLPAAQPSPPIEQPLSSSSPHIPSKEEKEGPKIEYPAELAALLTGDQEADAHIVSFYEERERLLERRRALAGPS